MSCFIALVVVGVSAALAVPAGSSRGHPTTPVGYMGCSITADTVTGYHALGGTRIWPVTEGFGGTLDTLENAKTNGAFWSTLERLTAAHPGTGEIWWQLCRSDDEAGFSDGRLHELAVSILDQLRRRVGDVRVIVSPQPDYVPPHICKGTGEDGPRRMLALANRLAAEGRVLRGPDFPALEPGQLRDGCHANEVGQKILGGILRTWFDGVAGLPAPVEAGQDADPPRTGPGEDPSAKAADVVPPISAAVPAGSSDDDDGWMLVLIAFLTVISVVSAATAVVAVRRSRRMVERVPDQGETQSALQS